jgi:glycosyltransferase 2 family protein
MERPAADARGDEGRPDVRADRIAQWVAAIEARRPLLRRLGIAFSLLIISVSTVIFIRTLVRIDPEKFKAAFAATGGDQIALSFGLTAMSYFALTGYDSLALKHLKTHVPYRLTALAAFTSYAISFTLGFPLVTGGAVRFWIYGPAGLSAGRVASLTLVAGVTFWLGMALIVGASFAFDADAISNINHFNVLANQLIGWAVIAALIAYLAWVTSMRRRGKPVFLNFSLPGPLVTLAQAALGAIEVCSAAGALYVLLPKGHALGFFAFGALYAFAAMLGIASHAPGGLGVFEATMLNGVGGSSDQLLASLLLFRGIYYVAPFVLAMSLLGAYEAVRRWRSLREAMAASQPGDDE